jgi:hypothetical protein
MTRLRTKHRIALSEQVFSLKLLMQKIALSHRVIQVFTSFVNTYTRLQEYRPIRNIYCVNIRDSKNLPEYALYISNNLLNCKFCYE